MSLIAIRTSTRTGTRIHFDGDKPSSKEPQFCDGHLFVERDHALSETFGPAPFDCMVSRRWHIDGRMQDTPERAAEPAEEDEAEEV